LEKPHPTEFITCPSNGGADSVHGLSRPAPGATFTQDWALQITSFPSYGSADHCSIQLGFLDGAGGRATTLSLGAYWNALNLYRIRWNTPASISDASRVNGPLYANGNALYVRLAMDATNLSFYVSVNGIDWGAPVYQEGRTACLLNPPNSVLVGVNPFGNAGSVRVLSIK
jgi:hypothetical protein